MHLVALVTDDGDLKHALRDFRDGAGRFHLHPVPTGGVPELLRGLVHLDFAGALILDEAAGAAVQPLAERSSLDAQDLGSADTLTVTPAGVMADHTFGRAISALLQSRRWHADGANAVVLGAGAQARSAARELARRGVATLTVLAEDRVEAERAAPAAAGPAIMARSSADPLATTLLERADLLVRTDPHAQVPEALLGPHLTIIDLSDDGVSHLRRRGMELGALTFNRRDVEAYRFEMSLSQILGGSIGLDPIMALFHAL